MTADKLIIFLKYFGILICALYMCARALGFRKTSTFTVGLSVVTSAFLSLFFCFITQSTFATDLIIIIISTLLLKLIIKNPIDILLPAFIIAYAINYGFYILSIVIAGSLIWVIHKYKGYNLILSLSVLILQLAFVYLLFTFKRLKNGFTFLQKKENSGIGLVISGAIVLFIALLKTEFRIIYSYIFFILGIIICIFGAVFWWRNRLTALYLEKNTKRQLDKLANRLREKDTAIADLEKENERLSSLIHRDNKIIPAMGMAVRRYLTRLNQGLPADVGQEGDAVIRRLDAVMKDRYDAIIQAKNLSKVLPDVHVDSINGIFQYMYLRAARHNIDYDVLVFGSVRYMIESGITELELCTILSDLIENAIIATSPCDYKRIVVTLSAVRPFFEIDIRDSGAVFEKEILKKMGLQRATSHRESGGSGIGLMTLFAILKRYKASWIMEEFPPKPDSLTKSVKIRFDGKSGFRLYSFRADELKAAIARQDIIILPADKKAGKGPRR